MKAYPSRIFISLPTIKSILLELDDIEDGMLKDFYKDSKKVDNKKVKKFFNYKFTYPTYKEGLDSIFNNMV